ncbi:group III truncated hemoglobin [Arthrobacter psychrolactophilus]|uniref:group III truncated hemoglobin n=1 Tax=Arthrobacter psychrolactophilus TaxID=92442 RepID=UPI001C64C98B|nr:group III truncated hemoglobin [Arthrobacter psychrolactophilus]
MPGQERPEAAQQRKSGRTTSDIDSYQPGPPRQEQDHRRDLQDRDDVLLLVETFYTKAFSDPVIGRIFTEVVDMDLAAHMPIMADFWQTVLFKAGLYKRNALAVHFDIHAKEPLTLEHFNRWLQLWTLTVDGLFRGEKAELAKVQAHQIGGSMLRRVTGKSASAYERISLRPGARAEER